MGGQLLSSASAAIVFIQRIACRHGDIHSDCDDAPDAG